MLLWLWTSKLLMDGIFIFFASAASTYMIIIQNQSPGNVVINFIKKRPQHRCCPLGFNGIFLKNLFFRAFANGCLWYWMDTVVMYCHIGTVSIIWHTYRKDSRTLHPRKSCLSILIVYNYIIAHSLTLIFAFKIYFSFTKK